MTSSLALARVCSRVGATGARISRFCVTLPPMQPWAIGFMHFNRSLTFTAMAYMLAGMIQQLKVLSDSQALRHIHESIMMNRCSPIVSEIGCNMIQYVRIVQARAKYIKTEHNAQYDANRECLHIVGAWLRLSFEPVDSFGINDPRL